MDMTFHEDNFFYVDYALQGGENKVQHRDVNLFYISNVKLCCDDHSAGSKPILNMDISPLDNTMSSDHTQLAQSSPHVQHDSLEVSLILFLIIHI